MSAKGKSSSCANASCALTESNEAPIITALAFSNSWVLTRNPDPSSAQPGVDALGYQKQATHFPRKSESEMLFPFWSLDEKSGAWDPCSNMFVSLS